jgi:dTDP-4-amino-4,6-dideoxygalactose transaminase
MTTGGEGGMLTTANEELWSKAWSYKDHGKSWDAVYNREHPSGFRWLHESFGTNWRMIEMQAAIGRIQLTVWLNGILLVKQMPKNSRYLYTKSSVESSRCS